MPKEALKRFEKHLLYSKEKFFYQAIYIRLNNTTIQANRTDANLTDRT